MYEVQKHRNQNQSITYIFIVELLVPVFVVYCSVKLDCFSYLTLAAPGRACSKQNDGDKKLVSRQSIIALVALQGSCPQVFCLLMIK